MMPKKSNAAAPAGSTASRQSNRLPRAVGPRGEIDGDQICQREEQRRSYRPYQVVGHGLQGSPAPLAATAMIVSVPRPAVRPIDSRASTPRRSYREPCRTPPSNRGNVIRRYPLRRRVQDTGRWYRRRGTRLLSKVGTRTGTPRYPSRPGSRASRTLRGTGPGSRRSFGVTGAVLPHVAEVDVLVVEV